MRAGATWPQDQLLEPSNGARRRSWPAVMQVNSCSALSRDGRAELTLGFSFASACGLRVKHLVVASRGFEGTGEIVVPFGGGVAGMTEHESAGPHIFWAGQSQRGCGAVPEQMRIDRGAEGSPGPAYDLLVDRGGGHRRAVGGDP